MTYEVVDDKGFVIETKTEKLSFKADEKKERIRLKLIPINTDCLLCVLKLSRDKAEYSTNKKQKIRT